MSARLILVTGKGGVGKTTVASATALAAAGRGRRTLLISADPAHSLSDVWRRRLAHRPRRLAENLWAQEVNAPREIDESWAEIRRFVAKFLRSQGVDELVAEELAVLPGAEELVTLLAVERAIEDGSADVVVVDLPPTASSLRLLAFPDAFHRSMERLFPRGRRLARALAPVAQAYLGAPVPDDGVLLRLQEIDGRLARLHRALADRERSSVRIVCNPQRVVIRESQRLLSVLHLLGLSVDLLVMNRAALGASSPAHGRRLKKAEESFGAIPVRPVAARLAEVSGAARLLEVGRELYGDGDPVGVLHRDRPMSVRREDGTVLLDLGCPLPDARELRLERVGDDVRLEVGAFRRLLPLPSSLRGRAIAEATLAGGSVRLRFAPRSET